MKLIETPFFEETSAGEISSLDGLGSREISYSRFMRWRASDNYSVEPFVQQIFSHD